MFMFKIFRIKFHRFFLTFLLIFLNKIIFLIENPTKILLLITVYFENVIIVGAPYFIVIPRFENTNTNVPEFKLPDLI
jgi:hypothetical protein